jgi:hypothetical protein
MNRLPPIVAGDAADIPIQAWLYGGAQPAIYAAGDSLVGYVYQTPRSPMPLFTAAVTWYTAPGSTGSPTQTGYAQGQVLFSITNAQAALLVPSVVYTVVVVWSAAATPSKTETIVRIALPVVSPAGP